MDNIDYEKMYKAVLQTATQWIKDGCTDKERICLECVFPELRESEDERTCRELSEFISSIKQISESGRTTWAVREEDAGMCERFLAYLEKQKEQKPEDWNNPDMREVRNNLISVCRDWECGKKTTLLPVAAVRARYFLEHLVEPQKPAEWSKEDEQMLTGIIERGSSQIPPTEPALRGEQMEWLMNRLKSLRPQPKQEWSEEEAINEIMPILNDVAYQGAFGNPTEERMIEFAKRILKSLRPSWKPSKEQTGALLYVLEHYALLTDGIRDRLQSLYDDLK